MSIGVKDWISSKMLKQRSKETLSKFIKIYKCVYIQIPGCRIKIWNLIYHKRRFNVVVEQWKLYQLKKKMATVAIKSKSELNREPLIAFQR